MVNVRELIPWSRRGERVPAAYREADPFMALHREMNRLFDDVFRGFDMPSAFDRKGAEGWSTTWPNIEVAETDKELRVTAEVPGLDEKDVEVLLEDGVLTVRGEKKSETEDKERQFSERYYGTFERRIAVGPDVQVDKVAAAFKNGVLVVTLPKSPQVESKAKRIAIGGK